MVTRCIGMVPAAIVAAALGEKGLNTMLVASQVVLSVVLPTVIFPLVYLCSRRDVMAVQASQAEEPPSQTRSDVLRSSLPSSPPANREKVYVSAKWVTVLGYMLTFVVVLANIYVFVQLGLGR